MSTEQIIEKLPVEVRNISVDWSGIIARASTQIASSEWVIPTPGTLVLSETSVNQNKTFATLSGGADGDMIYLENRTTFENGEVGVFPFLVIVSGKLNA